MMDRETGLTYMQQRYYDPQIGRFLSVDPVTANSGTGANFNRYWYANNNPYKFIDPDGRLGCTGSRIKSACDSMGMPFDAGTKSNRKAKQAEDSVRTISISNFEERYEEAWRALEPVVSGAKSRIFRSENGAAVWFSKLVQPITSRHMVEVIASILPVGKGFRLDDFDVSSRPNSMGLGVSVNNGAGFGVTWVHTHLSQSAVGDRWYSPFSAGDALNSRDFSQRAFVSLPNGDVYGLDPGGRPYQIWPIK